MIRWCKESIKMLKSMKSDMTEVKSVAFWIWVVVMLLAFVIGSIGVVAVINMVMTFRVDLVVSAVLATVIDVILFSIATAAAMLANGDVYE